VEEEMAETEELYRPAKQAVQDVEASAELVYDPTPQLVHVLAPGVGLYFPVSHDVHVVADVADVVELMVMRQWGGI
jgi:hypothetical protein